MPSLERKSCLLIPSASAEEKTNLILSRVQGLEDICDLLTSDTGVLDNDRRRIVYLRNTELLSSMAKSDDGELTEEFSMRRQRAVPAVLDGIDPAYRVTLYDLETGCSADIDVTKPLGMGITDHDFVLVMERGDEK